MPRFATDIARELNDELSIKPAAQLQKQPVNQPGESGREQQSPETQSAVDGRFAVMAPYWVSGLHNFEGLVLAEKLNKLIRTKKLSEEKAAIAILLAAEARAQELGIQIVPLGELLNSLDLKQNRAEPRSLLGGKLVRDKDGSYRIGAGGSTAVLLDQGTSISLKSNSSDACRGAMELAISKGWTAIELKGKPSMMADAWLEAKLMNLNVVNYHPTAKDQERLLARLAEESLKKKATAHEMSQTPEMVEIRPFVDANGETKIASVTYTVSFAGGKDQTFPKAKDAAKVFAGVASDLNPVVIRSVTRADGLVSEAVVSGFELQKNGKAGASSLEHAVDQEFDDAMGELIEAVKNNEVLSTESEATSNGHVVGPIVGFDGNWMGMKIGTDPKNIMWHDISKLKGTLPKIGELAEIKYSNGVGVIKEKEIRRDMKDAGREIGR